MHKTQNINIQNKKARFDYAILDTYIAGIVLTGTEIKSVRAGKVSLVDTFCTIDNDGMWLRNSNITRYENGTYNNHEERRNRKLLLTKIELHKIQKELNVQGITVVPLKMFINERGICKVEIAVCKGKKDYDKRESIKQRDSKRELDKIKKAY